MNPNYTPKDIYSVRITECKFEHSKKSNAPMLVLSCEIVNPDEVKSRDGTIIKPLGRSFRTWVMLNPAGDFGNNINYLNKACGITEPVNQDAPNTKAYEGQVLRVALSCKEENEKTESGEDILDDEGKPSVRYNINLDKWLGKGKVSMNAVEKSY